MNRPATPQANKFSDLAGTEHAGFRALLEAVIFLSVRVQSHFAA